MDQDGEVDLDFHRLIGRVASKAAGCLHCLARPLLGAAKCGIDEVKLAAVRARASRPLRGEKERVALDLALAEKAVGGQGWSVCKHG